MSGSNEEVDEIEEVNRGGGANKGTRKPLNHREKNFAKALYDGMGSIQAARIHLKWKCEPKSAQYQKAKDLAKSPRIKEEVARCAEQEGTQAKANEILVTSDKLDITNLRQFAYDRLTIMRDDLDVPAKSRFMAIQALERLNDPSKDINLIFRWIDVMWRFYTGHCPACHQNFPLWRIKNAKLNRFREDHDLEPDEKLETDVERRLALIKEAEKRRHPHPGQVRAISAPERHIVGTGPARAGKSFTLAMFCLMYFMIPGAETWILARIYDDAINEFEYLEGFLATLLYPMSKHMINVSLDKKSGEASITSRWGSAISIKSGKAKGSITGRELEMVAVAEPAWVDDSLYEEVRARVVSRLGRIIALGTPKGFGGFVRRMVKQASRGAGGKIRSVEDKLISKGCPWGQSLLFFNYDPTENPAYVKSELTAAKSELTKEEYASEFEGIMMASEGTRFPYVLPKHLVPTTSDIHSRCVYVLGVDQGPKNMGACLVGYDGHNLYVTWDFFDNSDLTIKANLITLNRDVPPIIQAVGGDPERWQLTIFDADPPVQGILQEMTEEHRPWKSDETYRPKNIKELTNWREETMEWINDMARQNRILFDSSKCDVLHDQIREALIDPKGSGNQNGKGWIIRDMWRGDHVVDAWLMACYAIWSGHLSIPIAGLSPSSVFESHKMAQDYLRIADEKRQLSGKRPEDDAWETVYGERRRSPQEILAGQAGYYSDES
jgi:hypothetical protein